MSHTTVRAAIDERGGACSADGTVRGADPAPLFRVDPQDDPPVFG